MAKRSTPAKPESRVLSVADMRLAIKQITRRLDDLDKLDPMKPDSWDGQSGAVRSKIVDTMAEIFGEGTDEYRRWVVYGFDNGPLGFGGDFGGPPDRRKYWVEGLAAAKTKLRTCIERLKEKIEDAGESVEGPSAAAAGTAPASDRVVLLNHNAPQYPAIEGQLDTILAELRKLNAGNQPSREESEMMAGIALLKAPEVKVSAVEVVLLEGLKWLTEKFRDGLIGVLAKALIVLLCQWMGIDLPG